MCRRLAGRALAKHTVVCAAKVFAGAVNSLHRKRRLLFRKCMGTRFLLDPLPWFGSVVGAQQINLVTPWAGGQHHAFADAEFHLARR
jgi:hypothetical protein